MGRYADTTFINAIREGTLKEAGLANDLMVMPPQGWVYGFPRHFNIRRDQTIEEWFKAVGYPQELIDQGMLRHVKYWEIDESLEKD